MSDRLDRLKALADTLEDSIAQADPEKRGPLAAQFRATLADIEALDQDAKAGDPIDELAKRRSARGAGTASGEDRPARGSR
ncbi:hypothetical protein GCM10009718_33180 [Isoptericola halotolerans]|uniref:Uncharacterized protein n=1 Tax=Isoptericola halotolerans TaxID=300560 RepID=A0ABX2A938_9MICO|nr:hypothetical protein [Isoptericola halotolerans]NOV98206.1 hypothetical protein [Isoptericola halotolerans]